MNTRLLQTFVPGRVGKTVEEGADTIVWLATSDEPNGLTDRFWVDRKEEPCQFRGLKAEEELWRLCEKMTSPHNAPN